MFINVQIKHQEMVLKLMDKISIMLFSALLEADTFKM